MRTDHSMRPAGALASVVAPPPPGRATTHNAVRTELPPRHTVSAATASAPHAAPNPITGAVLSHQVVIDSAAASIVYQDVDERTQTVVRQFPEQALLRRRAYLLALEAQKAEQTEQPPVRDRTI